ncbi:MAG: hypothetical protein ACRCZD_21680 [Phycicoccus sp.]
MPRRPSLCSPPVGHFGQFVTAQAAPDVEIVVGLAGDPQPVGDMEVLGQVLGGVDGDGARAADDLSPIGGTGSPAARASRYCVMPSGSRNSVRGVSPGVIGAWARCVLVVAPIAGR